MKVGMIGAGMFGNVVIPRYADAGAEVVAVCDLAIDRAQTTADKFKIPNVYDSTAQLLERDDLDVVHVGVPPHILYEVVSEVISAGKNVISEKPLTLNSNDASRLAQAAADAGVLNVVDHQMRYDPVHRYARKLVSDGAIGHTHVVNVRDFTNYTMDPRFPTHYATWTAFKERGGGVSNQHMVHVLDLIQSIFGWLKNTSGYSITYIPQRAELDSSVSPADLYELGDRAPTTGLVDVNGDDVAAVMGTTEDGALINVMSGWSVHHPAGVTWEAYGSDGTLALSESGEL